MTSLAPVLCLTHGGGPLPILGEKSQKPIADSLRTRAPSVLGLGTPSSPKAIVVITAHWETEIPTISNGARHELLYDYYNFPPESYELKYDAPGSPEVAALVADALKMAGIESAMDEKRGTYGNNDTSIKTL